MESGVREACAKGDLESLRVDEMCLNELGLSKRVELGKIKCLARQETMPFYRSKGMVYNAWFMGVSSSYLKAKLLLECS
jgi:hypothetical protein